MYRSLCFISSRSSLSSSSRLCISLPRMISTCSSKFLKGFVISNIKRPRRDEPQPGSSLRVVHCTCSVCGSTAEPPFWTQTILHLSESQEILQKYFDFVDCKVQCNRLTEQRRGSDAPNTWLTKQALCSLLRGGYCLSCGGQGRVVPKSVSAFPSSACLFACSEILLVISLRRMARMWAQRICS